MAEEQPEEEPADPQDPQTWLKLAEMKLDNARQIFNIDLFDDAISRAYYAMFYASKAALLKAGVDLRKHSSAVAKFRELFVLTGQVEAKYLQHLGRIQTARERSDYSPFTPSNREDAFEVLNAAESFIARMKELVAENL